MHKIKVPIHNGPDIGVFVFDSEEKFRKAVVKVHPWIKDELEHKAGGHLLDGLTVGTTYPAIFIYLHTDMEEEHLQRAIVHESLHATNCVLRYRSMEAMDREKPLVISDKFRIPVKEFASINIMVEGVNEEDQAELVAEVAYEIREAINGIKEKEQAGHAAVDGGV